MISRAHGLVVSLLLGTASAAGAYAMIGTAHLGDAETKPELVESRRIAAREQKLDAWSASLERTLKAKPPELPPLVRYPPVVFVSSPGAGSLPTPTPAARSTVRRSAPVSKEVVGKTARHKIEKVAHRTETRTTPPVTVAEREDSVPAPVTAPVAAPVTAPVIVAAATAAPSQEHLEGGSSAPPPPPATTTAAPEALSVHQQCRLLLRAAEGKSEQVKQEAERQCEGLKQAAEQKG